MCYNTTKITETFPYKEYDMLAYRREEMVPSSILAKGLGGFLDMITTHSVEKIAIVRHNVPEAVIIPINEYERMKAIADYAENFEIEQIIKDRMSQPVKMIGHEEMLLKLRGAGKNV